MNTLKSIALWGISKGLLLPQARIDRLTELSFLRRLLDQLQVDCVVDVGANRGQFAGELRGIGYKGLLLSFEPIASEFSALEREFGDDPQWRGHQIALGSKPGSMSMNIPRLTVMSSLLESEVTEPGMRSESVVVKRLDDVLPPLAEKFGISRVFLKMDTQGYDLEVFKGAFGCLGMIQGIQSELSVKPLYKNMPHRTQALSG